jgi:hypothetical protein
MSEGSNPGTTDHGTTDNETTEHLTTETDMDPQSDTPDTAEGPLAHDWSAETRPGDERPGDERPGDERPDDSRPTGRHPVNVGHLVMGLAFAGLVGIWALIEGDVIADRDIRWLLPIPWVLAGTAGLLAVTFGNRRRYGPGRSR